MTRHIVDHAIVLLLLVVVPFLVARDYRRFLARAHAGEEGVRTDEYRKLIALQWGLVLLLAAWWFGAGRSLDVSTLLGTRLIGGAIVTACVLALLVFQWRMIGRANPEAEKTLRSQIESVKEFLPQTHVEHATFKWLAVTAGVCEEIVYRGYLLWYLIPILGGWPAVLVGGVAFGLAHAYQGRAGILKTGLAGLFAGALYYWSGSLLWPIIVHAAVDLQGGAVAYRLLGTDR